MDAVSLYVTWPDLPQAEAAARRLLEARLAACVNLIPNMRSLYRWEGDVVCEQEVLMLVKTSAAKAHAARESVLANHPYDTPCVLHLHILGEHSAPDFLAWIASETC